MVKFTIPLILILMGIFIYFSDVSHKYAFQISPKHTQTCVRHMRVPHTNLDMIYISWLF